MNKYEIINGKVEWLKANEDDKEMAKILADAIRLIKPCRIIYARVNYEKKEIEASLDGEHWFSLVEHFNIASEFIN